MRTRTTWCITLFFACHPTLHAWGVAKELPQAATSAAGTVQQPGARPTPAQVPGALSDSPLTPDTDPAFSPSLVPEVLPPPQPLEPEESVATAAPSAPPEPELADTGIAVPIDAPPKGTPVHIEADKQAKTGDVYTLDGRIVIAYKTYRIEADHAAYDIGTQVVEARGHLSVDGGPSDEHILADHGTLNLEAHTGRFYDVTGTLGVRSVTHNRFVFTAPNPFTLTGQEVAELGPGRYQVIRGTLTSCRLPDPDWKLLARSILVENGSASARNGTFTFFHVPLFYLPYITHPVQQGKRQTGFLLPIFGNDTQRGFIAGESLYVVLGRSADATIGAEYFSRRGYAPFGQLRYRGRDENFASLHFRALFDRLQGPLNQGGQDIFADGRRQLDPHTRAVADIEYLSSYVYRAAFEQNYSAAINSEVHSNAFVTREVNGLAATGRFERYQLFRSASFGDEIRILHVPELRADVLDRKVGRTPLEFGGEAAAVALSRSEPGFQTSLLVPRLDVYPHLALPVSSGGFHVRAEAGVRETFYGKSQLGGAPGSLPVETGASLNRSAFVSEVAVAPPMVERDFRAPVLLFGKGAALRHTIEPELTYRYVTGVNGYANTLRFDVVDTLTNTNQLEYGVTQHVFIKRTSTKPCKGDEALGPKKSCGGAQVDALTWTLAQQHYYNPNFGGAVVPGQRNVFASTLDLTGVAYLQGVQTSSPVISRLRARTTSATDLEWDVDYDTRRGRLQSSNLFLTYHANDYSFSVTDARLFNLTPRTALLPLAPSPSAISNLVNFNQLRLAGVYGSPLKHGLSAGANVGYDFTVGQTQYFGAQSGYNRDCCGLSVEWRRYSLGNIRNDTQYLFSFTLAGVGSAGSLRSFSRVF